VSGTGTIDPPIHEDALPGRESRLEPKPDWEPRYPGSGRLAGKVALITGADSGIGPSGAALFAREGADVAILYLCEHDDGRRDAADRRGRGRRAIAIPGDVGDKAFANLPSAETVDKLGQPRLLVNKRRRAASDEDIRDITEEQLQRTFQTNIFGYFFMVQAARTTSEGVRRSVNCTSVTMYQGSANLLDYSATKGAITGLHPLAFRKPDRATASG
jgi:NAD(P)-dependent dehydrogenase (short-subunit alcohol dehydrogenase family)